MSIKLRNMFLTAAVLTLLNLQLAACTGNLTFSYWSQSTFVQERKQGDVFVNISLSYGATEAELTLFSPDNAIYQIVANTSVSLSAEGITGGNVVHQFRVAGKKLGVAQVYVRGTVDGEEFKEFYTDYLIKVTVWSPPYKALVDYFLIAWVSITYISMGVKIDLHLVWDRLKRPWPVLIGFLCQFVLMPLISFALAHLFQLDTFSAIGLVTDGAAPGGWSSNVLAILFGLDFVLSLTMTTCSTLVAIGTMPFNLWLYGTPFLDEELGVIVLPFRILIMQLGLLLVPVLMGMAIGHFFPKVAKYVEKALKPLAISLIVLSIGLGIPVKYYAFLAPWNLYLAGLLLPLIGGFLGVVISLIFRLTVKQALTVGLETGLQNALLATTMLALAFRPPEKDLMARVPLLISILSLGECLVIYFGKVLYDIATGKRKTEDEDKDGALDENGNKIDVGGDFEMKESKDNKAFDYYEEKQVTISTQTEDLSTGRPHSLY